MAAAAGLAGFVAREVKLRISPAQKVHVAKGEKACQLRGTKSCFCIDQSVANLEYKGSPPEKKMFSFGHCPNYLSPLPPIRATCTTFFGRQKRRFSAYYRTK